MTNKNKLTLLAAFLFLICAPVTYAEKLTAYEVVENSAQKIMLAIKADRKSYTENPGKLTEDITILLDPIVDFNSIAHSVMGKYKAVANDKQKNDFSKVFKSVMVNLYVKALVTFESEKIVISKPSENQKFTKKPNVIMHVTGTDGSVYKLTYSMRQNVEGNWQARNMIVDGINLGLTYLNQFDSAMNRYDKDMDKVIASWKDDMKI